MGGSQSQNQDNPNFNMEEYNRRVNNATIYQQGALHPNMAVHYTAPNEGKKTFAIEETQKRKVEAQFVFSKKSMQIVPSHNRLEMKFRYTAKAGGELTIFLLAQEIEEQATNITTEVHSEVKYTTVIGVTPAETELVAVIPLNRPASEMGFERRPARGCYPLLVRFTCASQNLFVYLRPTANFSQIQLIKEKIEKDGQGYYFE
jgi:hypothetical protein